jgi:hypothetical protein
MAPITAKLLVARSDKKDMLPAAADPKRASSSSSPRGPPRPTFSERRQGEVRRINLPRRWVHKGKITPTAR